MRRLVLSLAVAALALGAWSAKASACWPLVRIYAPPVTYQPQTVTFYRSEYRTENREVRRVVNRQVPVVREEEVREQVTVPSAWSPAWSRCLCRRAEPRSARSESRCPPCGRRWRTTPFACRLRSRCKSPTRCRCPCRWSALREIAPDQSYFANSGGTEAGLSSRPLPFQDQVVHPPFQLAKEATRRENLLAGGFANSYILPCLPDSVSSVDRLRLPTRNGL